MKRILSLLTVTFLIFQSCASYQGGRLPGKDVETFANRQVQGEVYMAVDIMNTQKIQQAFQFDLEEYEVQPIYIVIDNRSKQSYQFKKSGIDKQIYSAKEVAEKVQYSTTGRAATYGTLAAAGLVIWPLLFFAIPAVVDGVGSSGANQRIRDDYAYKEIEDGRVLPNGLLTGVVYVPRMKDGEGINFRLTDVESGEILRFRFQK